MTEGVPPLRWMASLLYLAVLVTGLNFAVAGLAPSWSPVSLAVFAAALVALLVVEWADTVPGRRRAIALLVARMVLVAVVAAADAPGFARVLFVLIPFFAYFSLGRRWSLILAAAYLLAAVAQASLTPAWWSSPEIVSDLLMLVAGMVLTVATAAVADGQRRIRMRAEQLVVELGEAHQRVAELSTAAERNRLARDIHDSVGHHLTAVSVQLAKAEVFRDRDPATADRAVSAARRAASRALQEVRDSVSALRAPPFVLATAVAALAEGMDEPGFRVTVELDGNESGHSTEVLQALYRVAQESLTNARRHAGAGHVRLILRLNTGATLEVYDDGRGFQPAAPTAGHGVQGMRDRIAAVGGILHIASATGQGTQVTATVPAPTRAAPAATPNSAAVPAASAPDDAAGVSPDGGLVRRWPGE